MATVTLKGNLIKTSGELPKVGTKAPDFALTTTDLSSMSLSDFKKTNLVLNIFPSVGTGVCAASVRAFNKSAASLNNTKVLCISKDLPFAQKSFCAAEGIENVVMLSDYKNGSFGKTYGLSITNGIFEALLSRCVIVIDKTGTILYSELVAEVSEEPNYEAALKSLHI